MAYLYFLQNHPIGQETEQTQTCILYRQIWYFISPPIFTLFTNNSANQSNSLSQPSRRFGKFAGHKHIQNTGDPRIPTNPGKPTPVHGLSNIAHIPVLSQSPTHTANSPHSHTHTHTFIQISFRRKYTFQSHALLQSLWEPINHPPTFNPLHRNTHRGVQMGTHARRRREQNEKIPTIVEKSRTEKRGEEKQTLGKQRWPSSSAPWNCWWNTTHCFTWAPARHFTVVSPNLISKTTFH